MKISLFNRILIGFAFALALVIVFGILNLISTRKLTQNYRRLEQSKDIVILLENLVSRAKDIQRAYRGFMLTSDKIFLTPYQDALEEISSLNSRLGWEIKNNPDQQRLHGRIKELMNEKIALTEQILFSPNVNKDSTIYQVIRGKALMDSVATLITQMEALEIQRQAGIDDTIRDSLRENTAIITTGITIFILILVYGLSQLYKVLTQRKNLFRELKAKSTEIGDANEELNQLNEELNSSNEKLKENLQRIETMHKEVAFRENQLNQAQYLSKTGSFVFNFTDGTFSCSSSYARIFDIEPERAFNSFDEFLAKVHPDDQAMLRDKFMKLEDLAAFGPVQYRILIENSTRHILAAAQLIDDGALKFVVGSVMDITEQKLAEQKLTELNEKLQRSYEDLESFNYSISHDLRAPVRSIIMYSNLFFEKDRQLGVDERKWVEVILRKAKHISELIEGLLQLSKYGAQSLRVADVDLNYVVDDVVMEQQHSTGKDVYFDVGRLPIVQADASLLRQVFFNLISNAVKFTSGVKAPRIVISSRVVGGNVEISVKDNGIGFDPSRATDLFAVFKRFHQGKEYAGSGIGLAIVKRIIESHGGQVKAYSDGQNGAEFTFTLPQAIHSPEKTLDIR